MKPKSFHFEAYTISQTAKKLGYRSTKTLYRLLSREVLEDYVYLGKSWESLFNIRTAKSSNSCRKNKSKYSN